MPRNVHITKARRVARVPAILRTQHRKQPEQIALTAPRLWNAKRRIKTSQGLTFPEWSVYRAQPNNFDWRSKVSPDVASFVDSNPKLLPEEKASLLRSPSQYFSRPHHVPPSQRKQVYLPNFHIVMTRKPELGRFYAHFQVPLWFNKLDMKVYLKNVYNVDVIHVRSSVSHSKRGRQSIGGGAVQGKAIREKSKKSMTVQLVEPFDWPEETTDFTDWEQDEFHRSMAAQLDMNRRASPQWQSRHPNQEHRVTIAKQALDMLRGQATWKPTWTQIPWDRKAMEGLVAPPKEAGRVGGAEKKGSVSPPPNVRVQAGGGRESASLR